MPIADLLRALDPAETALLDWLGPRVDDSMLREIANADYGHLKAAHLAALIQIRDRHTIPVPLEWAPMEVLNLMRWSEPDAPACKPGSAGERGHLMRAFCCAVLLRAADDAEAAEFILSENETLIQLVASVLYLGPVAVEGALRFLGWRVLRPSVETEERPFFALALLLLRAALFQPQDAADLQLLADWVVAEEAAARAELGVYAASKEWLFGLTGFDQRKDVWIEVAHRILLDPARQFPEPAASALRDIALRLTTPGESRSRAR